MVFIDNKNIDESGLNRSRLHLNRKGTSLLSRNFSNFLKSVWFPSYDDFSASNDSQTYCANDFSEIDDLRNLRVNNSKNIIFSYININSIRNKFENLCSILSNNVDIFCVGETKLDKSFPVSQFSLTRFHTPYRLDINRNSGGILVFVKSSIPSRMLTKHKLPSDIQFIPFEINLRKEKWLFVSIYKPTSIF